MFIHVYIICFSLIISSTFQNDVLFYNKLLKEHFFPKAKKSWISYTDKSLSVAIQRHMEIKKVKASNVRSSLYILHRFIKTLLLTTKTIQFAEPDNFDHDKLFWKTTRPVGKTRLEGFSIPTQRGQDLMMIVRWSYRLDTSLGINFTIDRLYFSENPLMKCSSILYFNH